MDVEALLSRLDMMRDALTIVLMLIFILIIFVLPMIRYFTKKPQKQEFVMDVKPINSTKSPITGRPHSTWSSKVLKKTY